MSQVGERYSRWCEFISPILRWSERRSASWPDDSVSRRGRTGKPSFRKARWRRLPWKALPSPWKERPPMSRALRRFEVLLPLKYNDGSLVSGELMAQTIVELRAKFGAVSCETQTI